MKHNRKTGAVLSTIVLLASLAACSIVFTYLPGSTARIGLTVACLIGGGVTCLVLYAVVTTLPDRRSWRVLAISLFILLAFVPLGSVISQRVTYSQFGLTVYGATPIPILDITVNRNGFLWFRPKSHRITRAELDSLIAPEVEVVVVGIGWDSVAELTDEAMQLGERIDLRVLPTPDAFAMYNALRAEGRTVVLLAHSTC